MKFSLLRLLIIPGNLVIGAIELRASNDTANLRRNGAGLSGLLDLS
jgi:hypothetical protein